jgi:50S ribosomal subunit-associated GTPase HflX
LVFCRADAHEEAYWSDEMRALAHSAGVRIVAEARQKRPLPDVATYMVAYRGTRERDEGTLSPEETVSVGG